MQDRTRTTLLVIIGGLLAASTGMSAQQATPSTIRTPELRRDAIVGVEVVTRPGERIEDGVILLDDGVITAVGSGLEIPAGYRVHDHSGMVVYPGLIEPALQVATSEQAGVVAGEHGTYPNSNVVPQLDLSAFPAPLEADGGTLRSMGFCTALMIPSDRIFRGQGQVVLLDETSGRVRTPGGIRPQAIGLDTTGGWRGGTYPGSSMGVAALIRQVLSDARWHDQSRTVWANHPEGNEPPVDASSLVALEAVIKGRQPVIIDATSEIRALRGARLAEEFELDAIILGSGTEFRRADEIARTELPVLVPVAYPKKPAVNSARSAEGVDLRTLLTWKHAPENARRLAEAGTDIAFTTHRLENRSEFRANLAKAIEAGLSEEAALTALTTTPARLLKVDEVLGTIEAGRIGNLVVVEGNLFEPKDPIREVWVAGRRHVLKKKDTFGFPAQGELLSGDLTREVRIDRDQGTFELRIQKVPEEVEEVEEVEGVEEVEKAPAKQVDADGERLAAKKPANGTAKSEEQEKEQEKKTAWKGRNVKFTDQGVSGVIDGDALEIEGPVRFDAVLLGGELRGLGETADGGIVRFIVTPVDSEPEEAEPKPAEKQKPIVELVSLPRPLGAYGRGSMPDEETVLFENARIWTGSNAGILENASLLIRNGRIQAIGQDVAVPEDCRIIDATGLEITPGLIDCHSHTGIDGSVNESRQNNSAEVRIGDVIDPDDINWYRQLAGGLTAANQLHGSANPIGGQNAVVKLRWGAPVDGMHLDGAMPGIKFALGENVVRPDNRYPDTRMGVAAFIEDAFRAASEYEAVHAEWNGLDEASRVGVMPPRRDLELETLAEIIASERLIHCHSYRQDEILMLIRTAERWGFTIGTLQHVLEGYKVAEAIAEHGAGASSFSDWWAYKMEVMDAVPYNGALMTKVGVLASFNSDSNEVARRMNTEAAKAVRYGGLDPHEALKLVTINPARQLRIDGRTGSLELGKDADLAVWNGDPLSTYTRCEQTWIDGRKYFDIAEDARLTEAAGKERAQLLASLVEVEKRETETKAGPPEGMRRGPGGPGRPGGRRGPFGPPPVTTQGGRISTLARMLEAREDYLYELVRRGSNPDEIRPGECGCGDVADAVESVQGGMGR